MPNFFVDKVHVEVLGVARSGVDTVGGRGLVDRRGSHVECDEREEPDDEAAKPSKRLLDVETELIEEDKHGHIFTVPTEVGSTIPKAPGRRHRLMCCAHEIESKWRR